jgi:hypothetical protein
MKYYCIEPATKDKPGVCVLPTKQEPQIGDYYGNPDELSSSIFRNGDYTRDVLNYEEHFDSLEKFPTSCDRVGWFEGREQYQENFFQENGKDRVWRDCDKWEYNMTSDEYRRKFIVPQSEEKDLASIPNEEDKQKEQKDEPKDGFRNYLAKALAPKVEPQPAPKDHIVDDNKKVEKTYTESEVREAFSEGYDSAMHHEEFNKAWEEFKKDLPSGRS